MVSDAHWQKDDKDQIIKDKKMANLKWMMMLLLKRAAWGKVAWITLHGFDKRRCGQRRRWS